MHSLSHLTSKIIKVSGIALSHRSANVQSKTNREGGPYHTSPLEKVVAVHHIRTTTVGSKVYIIILNQL